MPCPLFLPGAQLPLSDIFGGTCAADSDAELSTDKLTQCCNPGYARARCRHAASVEADSNRFLVRSDDGACIEIAWATEFNHHPIAVGTLRIGRAGAPAADPLEHQARACADAYLRQTGKR
jgi:hypothetical protein